MKIGFIGVGTMGSRMSSRLVHAGHEVIAYDILPDALERAVLNGCKAVSCSAEVAEKCDVIIGMMPQSKDTRVAIFGENGAAERMRPGTTFVDMSTGSPTDSKAIYAALKKIGVSFLDAPVSGGIAGAEKGTLSVIVSGDRESYDAVLEILKVMGKEIFYVGCSGTAHTIKLINNMLTGINLAGICEAMVMGMNAGIDPELLLSIINSSSGESYSSRVKIPNFVFPRAFSTGFKVRLQLKDMKLATDLARDLDTPALMGNVAKEYFMAAYASGHADEDASSIVKVLEGLTGVEVRPSQK